MRIVLKRIVSAFVVICMLVPSLALAAKKAENKPIPDFCMSILQSWGATNEKELQHAILTHWEENQPKDWSHLHYGYKKPVSFQFGGTTEEVISSHKGWDVAIVSSKDVDLQKLANAGIIISENTQLRQIPFKHWNNGLILKPFKRCSPKIRFVTTMSFATAMRLQRMKQSS